MNTEILVAEKIIPGGQGFARMTDGRAVLITGALKGEKLKVGLDKEKKSWAAGHVLEVLEPSPERVEPPCPYYSQCGGCDLQFASYPEQLKMKRESSREAFCRTGGFDPGELEIVSAEPFGYRNRMQFHLSKGVPCLKKRQSEQSIPIKNCLIAHPRINDFLGTKGSFPYQNGQRFVVFADDRNFFRQGLDNQVSTLVAQKEINFSMKGFFQSNLSVLDLLLSDLSDLPGGEGFMDLYCGAGLFGAFFKDRFKRVLAVEENYYALDLAKKNIGTEKGSFIMGKVEKILANKAKFKGMTTVLVDPPRTGLDPKVAQSLAQSGIPKIIYVSCNPVTQARDLSELLKTYDLEDIKLYDFYPQTSHIESMVRLKKKA